MRQADQFQRHVGPGAAGALLRLHQVGHGADRFPGAERIVGGNVGQRQHRQELGGIVLQAVADAGGNPAVVQRQQVVSAAGKVPAQAGDGVDLLSRRIAALDFASAAEGPAKLDEVGGRIVAGVEGLLELRLQGAADAVAEFDLRGGKLLFRRRLRRLCLRRCYLRWFCFRRFCFRRFRGGGLRGRRVFLGRRGRRRRAGGVAGRRDSRVLARRRGGGRFVFLGHRGQRRRNGGVAGRRDSRVLARRRGGGRLFRRLGRSRIVSGRPGHTAAQQSQAHYQQRKMQNSHDICPTFYFPSQPSGDHRPAGALSTGLAAVVVTSSCRGRSIRKPPAAPRWM